ncbi:MAG TPA: UvrD-helicase domain-containing protein [Tenuifilaceae bacterium]|nr:UvrD-helicase domain-containing protein [Tenuifilaceae bacterium]
MSKLKLYKASAGSGKTFRLASEYINMLVAEPSSYRNILAVTFTNKATAEMKERILKHLFLLWKGRKTDILENVIHDTSLKEETIRLRAGIALSNILHDYTMFSVSTIDSFVQRVIQNLLWELGFTSNRELKIDYSDVLSRAVDRLLDSTVDKPDLFEHLKKIVFSQLENEKSPNIRKSLIEIGELTFSEPFRLLSSDELEGFSNTDNLLADAEKSTKELARITNEIRSKAKKIFAVVESDGFNQDHFKYKLSGVYGSILRLSTLKQSDAYPEVKARMEKASNDVTGAEWYSSDFQKSSPQMAAMLLSLIQQELQPKLRELVDIINSNQVAFNTYLAVLKNIDLLITIAEIQRNIREILSEEDSMILAESGPLLREFVKGNDAPFVYEKLGTRYDSFMLDEFQDTSVIQWENFKPLIENGLAQGKFSMVVGDVKQAIYRWRNSDWRIMAERIFNEFDVDENVLKANFRSSKSIVEFNNNFFSFTNDLLKKITADEVENVASLTEFAGVVGSIYNDFEQQPHKHNGGYVQFAGFEPTEEMSYDDFLKERLLEIVTDCKTRGYKAGDIAFLVRKNNEGKAVADALLALKKEYAHLSGYINVVTQEALKITSSGAVRLCIAAMRLINNHTDTLAGGILAKEVACLENSGDWEKAFIHFDLNAEVTFLKGLQQLPLTGIFENIVEHYGLNSVRNEVPFVAVLHEQVINFSRTGGASLTAFLNWWNDNGEQVKLSVSGSGNAINILTIHKAKGLEFPVVVLPFGNIKIFEKFNGNVHWVQNFQFGELNKYPIFPVKLTTNLLHSAFQNDYIQELVMTLVDALNLMYVAFTRPKDELYVIYKIQKEGDNVTSLNFSNIFESILPGIQGMKKEAVDKNALDVGFWKYEYGSRSSSVENREDKGVAEQWILDSYPAGVKVPGIVVELGALDFFNAEPSHRLEGLRHGTVMHRLLSMVNTADEIDGAVQSLLNDGVIKAEDAVSVAATVKKAISVSPFSEWFSPDWEVKTERPLLTPDGKLYRPDRVMVASDKVVVVDYKFGEPKKQYTSQVVNYMKLLSEMGYKKINGYIWYVQNMQAEQVFL